MWLGVRAGLCLGAVLVVVGCSESPPELGRGLVKPTEHVGTVRQANHTQAICSSPSDNAADSCILYPSLDTTVYSTHASDYGLGKEMCVGFGGLGNTKRALL